jgi:pimeloyl-ACP methyl ester carboxylesterase
MTQRNPQFQLATIEGAGHNVHVEEPGVFSAAIREFTSSLR